MLDRLPEFIDPLAFADKHSELTGRIKLSSLDRLSSVLAENSGTVAVTLVFAKVGRLATVEGRVSATLVVRCQNCLQTMALLVDSTIKLGIVSSMAAADALPEAYEPLWVGDKKIPLKDIVEDELLLALPAFPKHRERCYENAQSVLSQAASKNELSNLNNPFSILAKLKDTGDQ
ncbi:MAG: metal-binding protein [Gammaproteobacteria bacterium HGW-Gammaproteobacteria-3]|nr:MAG: metal-binding protein [Gammaproteobacteria bacterium HGW-Gammaproteobacteria-3]